MFAVSQTLCLADFLARSHEANAFNESEPSREIRGHSKSEYRVTFSCPASNNNGNTRCIACDAQMSLAGAATSGVSLPLVRLLYAAPRRHFKCTSLPASTTFFEPPLSGAAVQSVGIAALANVLSNAN